MLELYHDWQSFCSIEVRLCLTEKGLDWTSHFVDLMKLEHTLSDGELDELMSEHPNPKRAKELRAAAREPFSESAVVDAKKRMEAALLRLEGQLSNTEWLAGSAYSPADVTAAPFIDRLEELDLVGLWKTLPNVQRWIGVMKERAAYQEAIPKARQRFAAANLV
jgi:glutathione S-transferase